MIPALYIALFLVIVGVCLYIFELKWRRKHPAGETDSGAPESAKAESASGLPTDESATGNEEESEECCGLHLVCEKDSLSPMSADIEYYDDEELDRFIGRSADSYTPEEEEEFRDVLMTLQPSDVYGWARSVTQRRLELPPDVRDELLMLVNEQRNSH